MKKTLIIFSLIALCAVSVNAQKQEGGEKSFEVNIAPLGGSPVSIDGIKFRKFTSENTAIRIGLHVGSSKVTSPNTQDSELGEHTFTTNGSEPDGSEFNPLLNTIDKTFDIAIRPGIEKHFEASDKVSPYVGVVAEFAIGNESTETEYWGSNKLNEANPDDFAYVTFSETESNGFTRFGLNLVAGADIYITDYAFIGFEFGFGFSSTKEKDTTFETTDSDAWALRTGMFHQETSGGSTTNVADDFPVTVNDKMFRVGPNVNGHLRLGVLFP